MKLSARSYSFHKDLALKINKLFKKDRKMYEAVMSKIDEIASSTDIKHYKNLRSPLHDFKRVHIMKSFVLVFTYMKSEDSIFFVDFDHHDKIYRK